MTNTPPPDSRAEVWLEGHVLHQRRGALSGSVVLTPDMATWLAALLQELDAAEDFAVKAFQERDNWRTFARSRKDKVLIDTITSLEAHLEVAQAAVLHEERRAEAAESARKAAEEALAAAEDRSDKAERERDNWRAIARSRKDGVLLDTVMSLEAHLHVAQAAVLVEGDRAEDAEARLREVEAKAALWDEFMTFMKKSYGLVTGKWYFWDATGDDIGGGPFDSEAEARQALEQSPTQEVS